MADAPKRIWAFYAPKVEDDNPGCNIVAGEKVMHGAKEYTRSDLLPALLAAERRKALEEAADRVGDLYAEWLSGTPYTDRDEAVRAIRALMEKEQGE